MGLFNQIIGSTVIKNLEVSGSIEGTSSYYGGITGKNDRGTITNCVSSVSITGTRSFYGGIVGHNNYGTIKYCISSGTLTKNGSSYAYIAGITGSTYEGTITNCTSLSDISASNANQYSYAGRVIGRVTGAPSNTVINNCYYLSTVTTTGEVNADNATGKTIDELKGIGKEAYNNGYTLYAASLGYTAVYTVTFNTNGGAVNSGNITTYEEGTGATLPTDVTRNGYTFAGWYDNENLTGSAVTSIETAVTGNKVYWAKWTPNASYSINENLTYNGEEQIGITYNNETTTITGTYKATNVGDYTATLTPKTGYTWSDGTTDARVVNWSISSIDISDDIIKFENETVEYNKTARSIKITGNLNDGTIKYGTTEGTYDLDELPTYTDAGTYTIYYKASKANYNDKTGSATLTITKKPITVEVTDKESVYGDEIADLAYSVTSGNVVNGDNLGITYKTYNGETEVILGTTTAAGTYTIKATSTNTNYNVTFVNGTYTVNKKTITEEEIKEIVSIENQLYTGEKVEPEIVIKDGEKIVPSSEYTVKYSDNIKPGIAKVTIKNAEGGNYTVETTELTFVIIDPGKVEFIEPETSNANNAKVTETAEKIIAKIELTEEDVDNIKHGKNLDVYLEVKDISNSISSSDKKAIEEKLGNSTIGLYLDINLFKQVEGQDASIITKTKEPITISFELPDELINNNSKVERTYKILRLHDGLVDELEVKVDGKTATFETDKFSTYALTYADTSLETPSSPKTGDHIIIYVVMFIVSLLGIRTLSVSNKRKSKKTK